MLIEEQNAVSEVSYAVTDLPQPTTAISMEAGTLQEQHT